MTVTAAYTSMHSRFASAARENEVRPHGVRTLVAVADLGGSATTHEIAEALGYDAAGYAMVRRAVLELYRMKLATGVSTKGGKRRPGTVSQVTLTHEGQRLADDVRRGLRLDERAELELLRDVAKRWLHFDGGPELMSWEAAHRLHAREPYIGCPFCRERFVLADA